MIQTYFGNGKGKTTAAIGSAIRFCGCGNKVLFVQFLKNNDSSELNVLNNLEGVEVLHSEVCYNLYDNLNQEKTKILAKGYNKLLFTDVKAKTSDVRMIILDEALDAVDFGYIDENEFSEFLNTLKARCEIILTGHKLTEKIAEISDYISEIKEIKHPYTKGVAPRKGIEF